MGSAFPTRSLTRWLLDDPTQRFTMLLDLGGEDYCYELEILHDPVRRLASIQYERLLAAGRQV